jgi:hypothetical protein
LENLGWAARARRGQKEAKARSIVKAGSRGANPSPEGPGAGAPQIMNVFYLNHYGYLPLAASIVLQDIADRLSRHQCEPAGMIVTPSRRARPAMLSDDVRRRPRDRVAARASKRRGKLPKVTDSMAEHDGIS